MINMLISGGDNSPFETVDECSGGRATSSFPFCLKYLTLGMYNLGDTFNKNVPYITNFPFFHKNYTHKNSVLII